MPFKVRTIDWLNTGAGKGVPVRERLVYDADRDAFTNRVAENRALDASQQRSHDRGVKSITAAKEARAEAHIKLLEAVSQIPELDPQRKAALLVHELRVDEAEAVRLVRLCGDGLHGRAGLLRRMAALGASPDVLDLAIEMDADMERVIKDRTARGLVITRRDYESLTSWLTPPDPAVASRDYLARTSGTHSLRRFEAFQASMRAFVDDLVRLHGHRYENDEVLKGLKDGREHAFSHLHEFGVHFDRIWVEDLVRDMKSNELWNERLYDFLRGPFRDVKEKREKIENKIVPMTDHEQMLADAYVALSRLARGDFCHWDTCDREWDNFVEENLIRAVAWLCDHDLAEFNKRRESFDRYRDRIQRDRVRRYPRRKGRANWRFGPDRRADESGGPHTADSDRLSTIEPKTERAVRPFVGMMIFVRQSSRPLFVRSAIPRPVEPRQPFRLRSPEPEALRVIELGAGLGGMAIGLNAAGFGAIGLFERDRTAFDTLLANPGLGALFADDIRRTDFSIYKSQVDLLASGFLVDPFDVPKGGPDAKEERDLFLDAIDVVTVVKPRAILLELMKNANKLNAAGYRSEAYHRLRKAGYDTMVVTLESSRFGIAQSREHYFLVGFREGLLSRFRAPTGFDRWNTSVGETLYDLMSERGWPGAAQWRDRANSTVPMIPFVGDDFARGGQVAVWNDLGIDPIGIADHAPGPDYPIDGRPKLTLRMAARLQGFPDHWKFEGNAEILRPQIASAVPPVLSAAMGIAVARVLTGRHIDMEASISGLRHLPGRPWPVPTAEMIRRDRADLSDWLHQIDEYMLLPTGVNQSPPSEPEEDFFAWMNPENTVSDI